MTLLVIIIVLLIQRYLGWGEHISRTIWFEKYLNRMQGLLQKTALWSSIPGVILILLPVLILIGFLQWLLNGWFFDILKFLFDLIVLWFCLNAYHLKQQLSAYFSNIAKNDIANSQEHGTKFVRPTTADKIKGDGITALARAVTCEIFLRAEEDLFGILFWFILLGPIGAVAYFLTEKLRDLAMRQNSPYIELLLPATKVFGVLDWIPVRILGLSYALVGHFVMAFNYWRKNFLLGIEQTAEFAINAGFAALNMEHVDVIHADIEENQAALGLVDRAVFLWVVIVAVFTLGGWL